MRVAGGVIAIVVGVIQTILMAIAVFATDALDTALTDTDRTQLEEAAAGGDANAQAALDAMSAVGDVGWTLWIFLIVSIVVVILGIMICASKNPMNGLILAVIGVVLIVLAIIWDAGILSILWNALFLLAGILGYMGAKQQSTSPAV
ncbi:MAG: hypothetical protein ACFCVH_21280 [Alphaproteobacteria bacterium]